MSGGLHDDVANTFSGEIAVLAKIKVKIDNEGLVGLVGTMVRRMRFKRLTNKYAKGKCGLEIGGPSGMFDKDGLMPIYECAENVDNCNFSNNTTWEGAIAAGETFKFNKSKFPGSQYVMEASNLNAIESESYDFVASSHVIEHCANPLQALNEWKRVLREKGILMLVVPHKDGTFDHNRPVTSLAHLVDDFDRNVCEDDLTHLSEALAMHDLSMDVGISDMVMFKERSVDNLNNRCLHHHVFNTPLVVEVVNHIGLQLILVVPYKPFHIAVIAKKMPKSTQIDNTSFLSGHSWKSPFTSDR